MADAPDRYHLTLTSTGRPVTHGWWGREADARRKVAAWVGKWGDLPDAHITLVDEGTGETLTQWPGEA